jgi:hypothetical protein
MIRGYKGYIYGSPSAHRSYPINQFKSSSASLSPSTREPALLSPSTISKANLGHINSAAHMSRLLAILVASVAVARADTLSQADFDPVGFAAPKTAGEHPTSTIDFLWPFPTTPGPIETPHFVGTPIATLRPGQDGFAHTTVYAVNQCVTFSGHNGRQCPEATQPVIRGSGRGRDKDVMALQVSIATGEKDPQATSYGARFQFPSAKTPVFGSAYCTVAPATSMTGAAGSATSSGGKVARATGSSAAKETSAGLEGDCRYHVVILDKGSIATFGNRNPVQFQHGIGGKPDNATEMIYGSLEVVKPSEGSAIGIKAPIVTIIGGMVALCAALGVGIL